MIARQNEQIDNVYEFKHFNVTSCLKLSLKLKEEHSARRKKMKRKLVIMIDLISLAVIDTKVQWHDSVAML